MGLRERNAAQTRTSILESALDLFIEQGYDSTRMEQVAARADVGTSTLYRYFPSKEQLLTEPLALRGQMAAALQARPPEESLELALGHALTALISTPRPDTARLRHLMAILQTAPGARARLLEEAEHERIGLEQAIADRLERPRGDLFCLMTSHLAMTVLQLLSGEPSADAAADNATAAQEGIGALRRILGELHRHPPVLPLLGD